MSKRAAVNRDAVKALVGDKPQEDPQPSTEEDTPPQPQPEKPAAKQRLTVHLPPELIDQVKNAVFWTPGTTLASLAEEALRAEVRRREKIHGKPFPERLTELKGGRPLK